MNLTSPGKLVVLCIALVGAFVGLFTGTIVDTTAIAIIGPIVGYVVGNGVGARAGVATVPVISPSPERVAEVATKAALAAEADKGHE